MNEHDLLDAIGDIDPKHIESAGGAGGKEKANAAKRSNVARFRSLYLAAAGLLLVVVAGVVFRNSGQDSASGEALPETDYVSTHRAPSTETEGVTTMGAITEQAEETEEAVAESAKEAEISEDGLNMDFNSALINFIESSGFENQNYMVSPTSFRAALALAVSGADNETKDQLLEAMGFESMDELATWYEGVSASVDSYNEWLEFAKKDFEEYKEYYGDDAKAPEGSFDLQNSIWRNTKASGKLSKKYIKLVKENFGATAENVAPDKITDKVNTWINKNTNGLIPTISNDLSYADLILVNTLYLRAGWVSSFEEFATKEGDFTTISGDVVKKDFMHQQSRFMYYEDENGKFVVLPMNGGINAVFILGDVEDVAGKMESATAEEVAVSLPKFEAETEFSNNELVDFCKQRGAADAFTSNADFSLMSDDMSVFISDIIQKTKIKVDEEGIEAAAATAIMMTEGAFLEQPEVKEFTADKSFKFMILTASEEPELLFYGQIVE